MPDDAGNVCGPDITDILVDHFNAFIAESQGNLNPIWFLGANELAGYARRNGWNGRIGAAVQATVGCPSNGACEGTVTVGGRCLSQYHIDHLLIMVYIAKSYGAATARSAGQYQESLLMGILTEGSQFESSSNEISNADLNVNEVGIRIAAKLLHADENQGTTKLITREELTECFEGADMTAIGKKPGRGQDRDPQDYQGCGPCPVSPVAPTDLELPPIDL